MIGLDEKFCFAWETQSKHCGMFKNIFSERASVLPNDSNGMWDFIQSLPNGVKVPEGYKFALVKDDDLFRDSLNFVENVTAYQDRAAHFPKFSYHVHHGRSGQRVAPLEWFIQ